MNEPRPPSSPGVPQTHPQHPQRPPGVPPLPQQRPPSSQGTVQGQPRGTAPPQRPASTLPPVPGQRPPAASNDGDMIALDDEPIALEEIASAPVSPAAPRLPTAGASGGISAASASSSSVVGISATSKIKFQAGGDKHTYTKFKRAPHVSGQGATHVRTFHGRLSDDGLAYTDDKINEWLDNHPEIEVKQVNCLVGPLEGKITGEQGLIVVIWY